MLSSSQDQPSLVHGALIREGIKTGLILTCGLQELWPEPYDVSYLIPSLPGLPKVHLVYCVLVTVWHD
jgi:hypothetical protein